MSDNLRLIVNVYPRWKYGEKRSVECILKMLVPVDILVNSLVEQIVAQNDPAADYLKYGLMVTGQGKWLLGSNTISYYGLKDGDELDLCFKRERIKVKTLDGSTRTVLVDETLPVGAIVDGICSRLRIMNPEEYALMLEGVPESKFHKEKKHRGAWGFFHIESDTHWLHPGRLLREQGAFEAKSIILKRRFFFNYDNVDTTNPVELNLLYSQIQILVFSGQLPCILGVACMFAAAQLQVELGDYVAEKRKNIDSQLNRLMPSDFANAKGIKKAVISEYKKLAGMSQMEAKLRYVKLSRSLPTCGATFFTAEIISRNNRYIPVYLGISRTSIMLLDAETRKTLSSWFLHHMRRWSVLFDTITIDFGDYADTYLRLRCAESETVSDLMSGYINIVLKRREVRKYKKIKQKDERLQAGKRYKPNYKINTETGQKDYLDANSKGLAENEIQSLRSLTDTTQESCVNVPFAGVNRADGDAKSSKYSPSMEDEDVGAHLQSNMMTCKDKKFETSLDHAVNTVRVTNKLFKDKGLIDKAQGDPQSNLEARSEMGEDLLKGGVSPFGIVNIDSDPVVHVNKEMDKHILSSDIASTIVKLPQIVLKTALHRFNPKAVDSDSVTNDINILLHSQASFVRSFRSVTSGDFRDMEDVRSRLITNADNFFSKVQIFTDRLRYIYVDNFSLPEYLEFSIQLAEPANALLEDLGYEVPAKAQQEIVINKNNNAIDMLSKFISTFDDILDNMDPDNVRRHKLNDHIAKLKFHCSVPLAFIPAFCPVSHNFLTKNCHSGFLDDIKSDVKDIVALCESEDTRPEILDKIRKAADNLLNENFAVYQMMQSMGRDFDADRITQLNFVREKLDSILASDITVNEFADYVNNLSLSTMNMFNNLKLFENSVGEKDIVAKLDLLQKKVGMAYSVVMTCAREYAPSMTDSSLREELIKSIDSLKSVMEEALDGGMRSCKFYEVYSEAKALFSAMNSLVSYSKTALIPGFIKEDYSKLSSRISQFSSILSLVTSATKAYSLHPTRPAAQVRIVEVAGILCESSLPLITSAMELNTTCYDPNIKGLIQKSTCDCLELYNSLCNHLSDMDTYPTRIKVRSSISQLEDHLSDLLTARDKASLLVQLKGYELDIAYNDFRNSLKYARISNAQLLSDIQNGSISSAAATLARVVGVMQCISFATLGICSTTEDIDERVRSVDCLISYGKVLRELADQMDKAIGDPNIHSHIYSMYTPLVKSTLRDLSGVCYSCRKLVDSYNLSDRMIDMDTLIEEHPSSEVTFGDAALTALQASNKLIDNVNTLKDSLNDTPENQAVVFGDLHDCYVKFAEASVDYLKNDDVASNPETQKYVKRLIEETASTFKSLVDAIIEQDRDDMGAEAPNNIGYYVSSLVHSLDKCVSTFSKDAKDVTKDVINVKELAHPLDTVIHKIGPYATLSLPPSVSSRDQPISINMAVPMIIKACDESMRDVNDTVNRIIASPVIDAQTLENDTKMMISKVSDLTGKLLSFTKAVEIAGLPAHQPAIKNVIDIDIIKDAVNDVDDIVRGFSDVHDPEVLSTKARKIIENCSILHYSCKDVIHKADLSDEDKDILVGYCRQMESSISAVAKCICELTDSSDPDAPNIIKDRSEKISDLMKDVCAFLSTPKMCASQEKLSENIIESRELLHNSVREIASSAKDLLGCVGEYARSPSPQMKERVEKSSEKLLSVIGESLKVATEITPILDEYDVVRASLADAFKRIQEKRIQQKDKQEDDADDLSKRALTSPPDDEVIDLTSSRVDYDQFGILQNEKLGYVHKSSDKNTTLAIVRSGSTNLLNLLELVRLCEVLVECVTSGEGDIINVAKTLLGLYESVGEGLDAQCNFVLKSGEMALDESKVNAFMNSITSLVDSCREMLTYINWTEEKRHDLVAQIDSLLTQIKSNCEGILNSSLERCTDLVSRDLLSTAVYMMASHPSGITYTGNDSSRSLVAGDKWRKKNMYLRAVTDIKAYIDAFISEITCADGRFLAKPVFVKPIIESLFKMYTHLEDRLRPIYEYSMDQAMETGARSSLRYIGLALFRILDTYKAWSEGRIYNNQASEEFSDYTSELVRYLEQLSQNFRKAIKFMDVRSELLTSVDHTTAKLNEKIEMARSGALNPIDLNENCSIHKDNIMHLSMRVVGKVRDFVDASKEGHVDDLLSKTKAVLEPVVELTDETIHCAAALTPLNKKDQVAILTKAKIFYERFADIVNCSTNTLYNADQQDPHNAYDTLGDKILGTFEAIKDLVSCVRESGTETGPDHAIEVIESSKEIVKKSIDTLEDHSGSAEGAAVLSCTLSASKELSHIVPEFLGQVLKMSNSPAYEYTPIINKFASATEELARLASSAGEEIGSENYAEFLANAKNVCEKSLSLLDAVEKAVGSNEIPEDTLQEATKDINMAIADMAVSVESHIKSQNEEARYNPANVAEHELWLVRDTIKDACFNMSSSNTQPGPNSTLGTASTLFNEVGREVRNVIIVSLSILRLVSEANRQLMMQANMHTRKGVPSVGENSVPASPPGCSAVISASKKFAFVTLNLYQLLAVTLFEENDIRDVVTTSRVALLSLNSFSAIVDSTLDRSCSTYSKIHDSVVMARKSLHKLISIGDSSLALNKAEDLMAGTLGQTPTNDEMSEFTELGENTFSMACGGPVNVKERIEEMNARLKVIKIEKELEEARVGLNRIRKNIYGKGNKVARASEVH